MSSPVPWRWLVAYLAVLAVERVCELALSRRNFRRLRSQGAREVAAGHFPMFVVLHALAPVALVVEVVRGARPGPAWPLWLAALLVAQMLRGASMAALRERWNARIVVLPGVPAVRSGIYRWFAHPNYLAVAIEFIAAPLLFGAWRTAIAGSLLNAVAMAVRIPAEERALREAGGSNA